MTDGIKSLQNRINENIIHEDKLKKVSPLKHKKYRRTERIEDKFHIPYLM